MPRCEKNRLDDINLLLRHLKNRQGPSHQRQSTSPCPLTLPHTFSTPILPRSFSALLAHLCLGRFVFGLHVLSRFPELLQISRHDRLCSCVTYFYVFCNVGIALSLDTSSHVFHPIPSEVFLSSISPPFSEPFCVWTSRVSKFLRTPSDLQTQPALISSYYFYDS